MANRRSKSWYISRLVRANGIVRDEVVNGGSSDSDVAAIAQLRREADSEDQVIQSIRSAVDSDYALFNTKIAAFEGLTDSDLTTVSNLRNDLDSESAVIRTLSSAGSSPFTDSDSIHRIAVKSNPISLADSRALSIGKSLPNVGTSQVGDFFLSWDSEETIYQLRPATQYNTNMLSVGSFASNTVIYTSGTPSGANNASTPSTFPSPIGAGSYTRSFHTNHSNGGGYITFTFSTPTPVVYFYVTGSDPNARIQRINYENGDYALNASNSNPSFSENITWYGTTQSKAVNGNGSFDARHPDDASIKVTSIQFRTYDRSWVNYYWLFMSSANEWVPCGKILDSDSINKIISENSSGFATSSFDSDQIVAIINENTTAGSIDSDVAAVAQLRRDADSDSTTIQTIKTDLDQINSLVDSDLKAIADLRNDLDSESTVIRSLTANQTAATNITQTVYTFTTTTAQTTFSGNDDNLQTLEYSVGRIQVYLNGLLLSEGASADYTATNGTSVVLTEASDSEDVLTVVKFLGTQDDVITNKYIYKVAPAGNHVPFDSEFSGADENGSILSYTSGKIQVFLNGILLQDSDDYTATDGSSIYLLTAPDSEDVIVVYRYLGTQVAGFDSDQVVAIINENTGSAGFDSDQVTGIVKETFTNLGNRNIQLGGAVKDSDVLGYHVKILGNESNVDSEQHSFNLRNYVERKVCRVEGTTTLAYIYYGGFANEYGSGNQYDRGAVFINWTGHISSGPGIIYGRALHFTKQGNTITQGQAFAGSTDGNLPTTSITHDATNERFIVSIANGWGTADVTIQVGRYQKQIEWLV